MQRYCIVRAPASLIFFFFFQKSIVCVITTFHAISKKSENNFYEANLEMSDVVQIEKKSLKISLKRLKEPPLGRFI